MHAYNTFYCKFPIIYVYCFFFLYIYFVVLYYLHIFNIFCTLLKQNKKKIEYCNKHK